MADFTYNKQKRRWYRSDGSEVKPGNRVLGKNGIYYQYNTDGSISRVGSVSGGLDKSYIDWKKKHKQAVNTTLEDNAMRSSLIKDRLGKWRLNSTDHSTKTKQVDGKSYFLSKDRVWRNFDTGLKISEQKKQDLSAKNKALTKLKYNNSDESIGDRIKNHGIVEGLIDWGMDEAGVDENSYLRTGASLLGNGLYMLPGVGTALSLGDAGLAAARGDWTGAALTVGMGLVPMTRGLRSLKTVKKMLRNNKVGLVDKVSSKVPFFGKPAISKSQKVMNELRQANPAIQNTRTAAYKYLKDNKNPLSRLKLPGNHTINIGEKTARGLELANNWKVNLGLVGANLGQNYYRDLNNEIQYESQQQDLMNKQKVQDINSGITFGRMSNQDFNSMLKGMGEKQTLDQDTYDYYRDAYANGLE